MIPWAVYCKKARALACIAASKTQGNEGLWLYSVVYTEKILCEGWLNIDWTNQKQLGNKCLVGLHQSKDKAGSVSKSSETSKRDYSMGMKSLSWNKTVSESKGQWLGRTASRCYMTG